MSTSTTRRLWPTSLVTYNHHYLCLDLHQMIHVTFTNLEGLDEAGIDGGGLFREFLDQLIHVGFDPNRGFFKGNHEGLLYPNPEVGSCDGHVIVM